MSEKRDPFDGDYIGNIFGPKLTLYGGILVFGFTALVVYRHWALDVPFGWEQPAEDVDRNSPFGPTTVPTDTIPMETPVKTVE